MKSMLTCGIVGFALGNVTAAAGVTTIPQPVLLGAVGGAVLLCAVLRNNDVLMKISVSVAAWATGSFIALNYLLPNAH